MKNKNDEGVGAVHILLLLIGYIVLLSITVSFLLSQAYGSSVPGIELPTQKDVKTYSSEQSFIDCTANKSTFVRQTAGTWEYICGLGMRFVAGHGAFSYLLVDNVQKDSTSLYQNEYWINNTATNILGTHGDYVIILRYTGGGDQNEIQVKSDGFHIPQYFLTTTIWTGDSYFYPYPNANQITAVHIKTIYNDNTPLVDFYFNDNKIFTTTQLNSDKNIVNLFGRFYGGVASFTPGFILEDFQTQGAIISGLSSNIGDSLNSLTGILTMILKISVWSFPADILPLPFVIIFVNLPEAGIVICVVVIIIRGVG